MSPVPLQAGPAFPSLDPQSTAIQVSLLALEGKHSAYGQGGNTPSIAQRSNAHSCLGTCNMDSSHAAPKSPCVSADPFLWVSWTFLTSLWYEPLHERGPREANFAHGASQSFWKQAPHCQLSFRQMHHRCRLSCQWWTLYEI